VGFFGEGSGFLAGFGGLLGSVLSEQVWVFDGSFFCVLGSGCYGWSLWDSGFRVDPRGFVWVFSFCGPALVVSVYTSSVIGASCAF
jgi:hypothetical protein